MGRLPKNLSLADAVQSTRDISRDPTGAWIVRLENGKTIGALDIQWQFYELAANISKGINEETDWLLESWRFTLDALQNKPESLIGGVDWITKKWLLETFMEAGKDRLGRSVAAESRSRVSQHRSARRDSSLASTPAKRIGEWNNRVRRKEATLHSAGKYARVRSRARGRMFPERHHPYVINWDSIACDSRDFLVMGDPFNDYNEEVAQISFTRAGFDARSTERLRLASTQSSR